MATDREAVDEKIFDERANKAGFIVRYCRRHGITPEQVERWTDGQWLAAAEAIRVEAGYKTVKMPTRNGTTRTMVVEYLREPPESTVHPGVR